MSLHAPRLARLRRRATALDRVSARLAASRLLLAAAAVVLLAWSSLRPEGAALLQVCSALSALAFALLLWVHVRVRRELRLVRDVQRVAENEEHRARGGWSTFDPDGSGLAVDEVLASDLDVTGRWSLFQAISRCATPFGRRRLAGLLTSGELAPDFAQRQQAVLELRPLSAFRERVEALGRRGALEGASPETLLHALDRPSVHDRWPWAAAAGAALVPVTLVLLVGAFAFGWPSFFSLTLAAQVGLFVLTHGAASEEYEELLHLEGPALAWAEVLALVERRRFRSPLLSELRQALRAGDTTASVALHELGDRAAALSLRHGMAHPIVNALVLWDLFQLRRLQRWKRRALPSLATWFDVLGELEAIASLAAHAADAEPSCVPVIDGDGPPFSAEGLVHPLLPADSAVANDVTLDEPGRLLLVTGSNMSGKSTLLRAMGLNAALALAGGVAHARSLRMAPCRLLTSIHVTDSLDAGVSMFHAEVRRVKEILDAVEAADEEADGVPVLYLVDEILRGTNTRERLVASRGIIALLAGSGSAGLVTSHDLSLVELEERLPTLRNVHLRETITDGRMTFDYRLRSGPVTTTNALEVLRLAGIRLEVDDVEADGRPAG